ncbi:hypothetical protein P168DRAFT_81609 [Aspergillus campestris IBT 28561]|uniref:Uncharacterized protein n=1 Tax=Aspergillus campestris (strain IBT 28561) TaxID=1392248 RepID=A0A2I1CQN6_ASPC2|nr:uncharacterized protein P168DRAFT_81609 [Aspergillus campestris IBT 28561]PKX99940.1 hypothetical protein P168DRAFT_81609 [Aspergillus campestris IBT 28561]
MYGISAFKFNVLALEPGSFLLRLLCSFHLFLLFFVMCYCLWLDHLAGLSSLLADPFLAVPNPLKRGRGRRRSARQVWVS